VEAHLQGAETAAEEPPSKPVRVAKR